MSTEDLSRRDALMGSATTALAGLFAALAVTTRSTPAAAAITSADVPHLNALLTEEYKLVQAYGAGADILTTPPTGDPGAAGAPTLLAAATYIRSQHRAQATALASAITGAGGTPVSESTVIFTPPTGFTRTVANVLKLAANSERAIAVTFVKKVNNLSADGASLAASIAATHTQNFVILYLISKGIASGTMTTAMNAQALSPAAFVVPAGAGTTGLDAVAPFTFGPLNP